MNLNQINRCHAKLISAILGINRSTPMSALEMAGKLKVTFYPPHKKSPVLKFFTTRFKHALRRFGVQVIPYSRAIDASKPGKVSPGIVIVEQGEGRADNMAIHHVSGLRQNPLVALYDVPPPVGQKDSNQKLLDAIVGVLAWNLTHIPIFIDHHNWTVCTMNGAVIKCSMKEDFDNQVLNYLIPKLAAQVIPPNREELLIRKFAADNTPKGYLGYMDDLSKSSTIWKANGLMLGHTCVDTLKFKGKRYKRIVKAYLDGRSGMSYGFLARQLPAKVSAALKKCENPYLFNKINWGDDGLGKHNGLIYAQIRIVDDLWMVPITDVWVLGTRSGCDKTNIDRERDIVFTGLSNQQIILEIPDEVENSSVRPSYDTLAILSHAVGNSIAASVLMAVRKDNPFSTALSKNGLTISHWHGYPTGNKRPLGYLSHGASNLPVSCSTPQSAIYAFCGKMASIEKAIYEHKTYCGDIHIEPHHGTNIVGAMSLEATAAWIDRAYMDYFSSRVLNYQKTPKHEIPAEKKLRALAS